MARLFTPAIADFYEKYYADKGITIRKGDTVSAFEGEGGKVTQHITSCYVMLCYVSIY